MMEQKQLLRLIEAVSESKLTYFSLEEDGYKLTMKSGENGEASPGISMAPGVISPSISMAPPMTGGNVQSPEGIPAPAQEELPGNLVKCHLVGTFYTASSPESPPFAAVGDRVKKGQTVCLIEAMKMMSELGAPADCVVAEVLAKDGEAVGFGAPLFRIRRT